MGSKKNCKFPVELLSSDPTSILAMQDGHLTQTVTTTTLLEWRECVGHVDKSFANRMLPRLERSFMKSEGGVEILQVSDCKTREIVEIFDPRAGVSQAEKAGKCLEQAFTQEGSSMSEVVRIDVNCERQKRNKIREARERVRARLIAMGAAGVCCAASPATAGIALTWCGIFATLTAATLDAQAQLRAALAFECPDCSDAPLERFVGGRDRKTLRLAGYNNFYNVKELPAHSL